MWTQRRITLEPRPRGIHLIGDQVRSALPELAEVGVGLLHLHLLHTSAGLALNENASPDVRADIATWLDRTVPEGAGYWRHMLEGSDDMPAHMKSVITGHSLTLPIAEGELALGTWQGIYLCEFRDHGGSRRLVATINGDG